MEATNLNPLEYWTGTPAQFVKRRYSCSNGIIKDAEWSNRWKSLGGGLRAECVSGIQFGYTVANGPLKYPVTLKANSCGFITLASSAGLRFVLLYTASTEPSASYSLASLPEQPLSTMSKWHLYRPAQ